jgi:LEA14-like dessication related protein
MVLLLAMSLGMAACDSLGKAPNARVMDLRFSNLTADGVTIEVEMDVRNPTGAELRLDGLGYSMIATEEDPAMGPILEGSAGAMEPSVIPAKSKRRVVAPVVVPFTDVLDVLDAGDAGTVVPWRADLVLNARSGAGSSQDGASLIEMPMQTNGRLPIFKRPGIEASPFEWTDVGVLSAKGEIRVRVTNTNLFPLELNRVVYALEIQGARISSGGVTRGTRIAPGRTEEIVVPIKISAAKIAAAVYESSRRGGGSARFRGSVDLAADGIPVSFPFDKGTSFEQMRGTP